MSPSEWPAPIAFDPDAGGLPPSIGSLLGGSGRVPALLLVAGEAARSGGWAARASIALASTLGDEGQRIVLADLAADSPELHEALGVRNDEGMVDVFLYGASLRRVARAVAGHTFYFAPAGEYVPDPEAWLAHPRWQRLIGGFVEARAMLLLYVPAGTPGLDTLARRTGHAAVLAEPGEAEAIASALPDACSVDVILAPPTDAAPSDAAASGADRPLHTVEATTAPDEAPPAGDATADADLAGLADMDVEPIAVEPTGASAAGTAAAAPGAAAGIASDASDAGFPAEDELIRELAAIHRESKDRRSGVVLLVLLLLLALAVAGWFVTRRSGDAETSASPVDAAAAEPGAVQPATPIATPIPFSVVIESHQDAGTVRERVAGLRADEPEIGFYIAPVLVNDAVYYRVLAGPAADSASAWSLMQRLVEIGVKGEAQPWAVRNTAYAFHMGDFDTADAASARAGELDEAGIPAYVVEVPFNAGPPRFRVYAGAYQGPAEARVLAQLLRGQALDPELVRRVGRPAS